MKSGLSIRTNLTQEEYFILKDYLDEITWALEGKCNDIDCDKYMYIDLLKPKYKPVLEHKMSCMPSLKRNEAALKRLLYMKKFKRFREEPCAVCGRHVDTLGPNSTIVSFSRPVEKEYSEMKLERTHRGCAKKLKIPEGWKRFGTKGSS